MASLKRILSLSLACGGLLLCGRAVAQIAPGAAGDGPIAFDGESLERDEAKHLAIWHGGKSGSVNVTQNGARLVCDTLYIYFYGPGEGPAAPAPSGPGAKPAPTPAAAPGAKAATPDETSTSSIKQMVAEGHVFYVTQNETARGDHMVYDAMPDIITMTGGVIVVQGKNVLRGDKMVIDRKTGLTTVDANSTGRNNPNRVRAVIYNDQNAQGAQGQGALGQAPQGQAPQGQNAAKPPAAPAKKP
jgi:lipopolysaccharide export system protein LptA